MGSDNCVVCHIQLYISSCIGGTGKKKPLWEGREAWLFSCNTQFKSNIQTFFSLQVVDELEDQMCEGGNIVDYHGCDFFQRDGLALYLCFEQTTQGFMIDLNRGKYGIHVNARTMSVV